MYLVVNNLALFKNHSESNMHYVFTLLCSYGPYGMTKKFDNKRVDNKEGSDLICT